MEGKAGWGEGVGRRQKLEFCNVTYALDSRPSVKPVDLAGNVLHVYFSANPVKRQT